MEVKAGWHDHLYAALKGQLADGYLDGAGRRHGVYLVGWYGPDGWYRPAPGGPHPKAKKAGRGGLVRLARTLDVRAAEASTTDRRVRAVVVNASLPPPRASL